MYISHKANVIQVIEDVEWQCRRKTKGLSKPEYWVWLESVTTDGVPDYSGETDYSIVETEVDVEDDVLYFFLNVPSIIFPPILVELKIVNTFRLL